MTDKDLSRRLRKLGYPLFETEEKDDANATLAEMVQSMDLRLLEGFPVVLANSAEKGSFDYDAVMSYLKNSTAKGHLKELLLASLALYKALNIKFFWANKFYNSMSDEDREWFLDFLKRLKKNKDLRMAGRNVSSQRLKQTFNNYFSGKQSMLNELLSVKEDLGLEYALSQVFSPKQKELFLKKFRHEKLTKTEKEYFSRTVKKKVLALANPELHRLSKKLLE